MVGDIVQSVPKNTHRRTNETLTAILVLRNDVEKHEYRLDVWLEYRRWVLLVTEGWRARAAHLSEFA
jgi:hypothetical protein